MQSNGIQYWYGVADCSKDALMFIENGLATRKFCDRHKKYRHILTSGPNVTVAFISDGWGNGAGFVLQFEFKGK